LKLTAKITVEHSCNGDSTDVSFRELKREARSKKGKTMAIDGEDLSDSGIEKACDDISSTRTDVVPNSPRVPPDGADNDDIQIDQLRPHNHQYHQQFSINIFPEKCQPQQQSGTNGNVNLMGLNGGDFSCRINRLNSQQCQDSMGGQSNNQRATQHEHHTSVPFSNNTYAAFKKGNVVRGILCPSLTNSFR
jgi:hypothetical protein